jgi:hydroxymethylglutaryl-CoA reductase (NADPH)
MLSDYPKIPLKMDFSQAGKMARLEYLENQTGIQLEMLKKSSLTASELQGNIESFLGTIEIPVGLAGPILLNRENEKSEWVFAPVATSEGALVASMTRGAFAIGLSGGVTAQAIKQRMVRAPMFSFQNLTQANQFQSWIQIQFEQIKKVTQKYSNYANLIEIVPECFGKFVHLRFAYETGDAAGQNMTTTCTWHACLYIEEQFNLQHPFSIVDFVLESNGSSDKKASARSQISTRGTKVVAECHLRENVIRRVLKTSSDKIFKLYTRSISMAAFDGMTGYNVNVANTVAGFFASTGQDLACIHESSIGLLQMEKTPEGLYCSLLLPSLVVGTIGGGTGIRGPQEILTILGCQGSGSSKRLAEIICSFALGLEISTMSAITSGDFATSHERLGRNRPINLFKKHEFTCDFFNQNFSLNKKVKQLKELPPIDSSNAITMAVAEKVSEKVLGFFPFQINCEQTVLIKSKALDSEILLGMEVIAGLTGQRLKQVFQQNKYLSPYIGGHRTESYVYELLRQHFHHLIPKYYGSYLNSERETYFICQEFLKTDELIVFNDQNHPSRFTQEMKTNIVRSLAQIQGYFHQRLINGLNLDLTEFDPIKHLKLAKAIYQSAILDKVSTRFSKLHLKILDELPSYAKNQQQWPKTLCHNDFNPRNIAVRVDGTPCFYDWEMSGIGYPQRDLMEFIAFTYVSSSHAKREVFQLIESHRLVFNQESGARYSRDNWIEGCQFAIRSFIVNRLAYYHVGDQFMSYSFLDRVYQSSFEILETLSKDFQ